jgi:hypothetical protein
VSTAIVWLLVAIVALLMARASMRRRRVGENRGWGEAAKPAWYRRWWAVAPALLVVGFIATGALNGGGSNRSEKASGAPATPITTLALPVRRASGVSVSPPASTSRSGPAPRAIRKWSDAEAAAAEWMTYWGYVGATQTALTRDGGIDVMSETAIAQVKDTGAKVGPGAVQQLFGIAALEKKAALFFARSGYTGDAQAFAARAGVALFTYDSQGRPEPQNDQARAVTAGDLAA